MSDASRPDWQAHQADTLLEAYLRCLEAAERVPFFSLFPYLRLFAALFLWEFALTALFIVPVLDIGIAGLRLTGAARPDWLTPRLARYVWRPFRGVWNGDLSGLQIVRIRSVTKAFVCGHISASVDTLQFSVSRARLACLMANGDDAARIAALEADQKKLDLLTDMAKSQNKIGALLATGSASAVPVAAAKVAIPALVQLLPANVTRRIGDYVPLTGLLKTLGLTSDNAEIATPTLLLFAGAFLTFVLVSVMSCHIEKRRIFRETGTYATETTVLGALGIDFSEMPMDALLFAGAIATGFLAQMLYDINVMPAGVARDAQVDRRLAVNILFYGAIAVVVIARRWYLRWKARGGTGLFSYRGLRAMFGS
jgi:hypothetical protein